MAGLGPVRNPVLLHRVRLFSLVPLVWESNPKLQGGLVQDPTTRPIGDLIPTIGGSGAHPGLLVQVRVCRCASVRGPVSWDEA